MRLRLCFQVLFLVTLLSLGSVACAPVASEPISLISFTENYVDVSIYLERNAGGSYLLSGTFTPPEGYHLYSKDIPSLGIGGFGRPTLLEVMPNSQIQVTGELMESVSAEQSDFEPKELLVYPAGAVTLSLPVELASGNEWIDAEIQVTYMACSPVLCKPPVVGKVVWIRIPATDIVE